ncbi:MAG: cytochrome c3 family protein [Acidobacteriota bacterium]
MNKKRIVFSLFWAAVFVMCWSGARAKQVPVACIACHTFLGGELARPVAEWNVSVHRQNGIACDLCHGGDANVDVRNLSSLSPRDFEDRQSRAMSKSHGFIGKPSGKEMFSMCARCHNDSVDRYASSIMGRAYLDGKGGPSCVACHNAHNNIIPSVPKVCESCHKDTTGFDQIDPMNVSVSTINKLSRIRIHLAEEKAKGATPALAPGFPEDLDPYQIGLLAFGGVVVMFVIGYLVYVTLERRR